MRYPKFLKDNGSIGFPAPSFGCATEPYYSEFLHMLEVFRDKGYILYPGSNSMVSLGVGISNSPDKCAGELTAMYCDDDIDTLISCGGGELMCEILEFVDFEKITKANPKLFMGYSDNTNFIFLLNTICDVAGIYGPCAGTLGTTPWDLSINDALSLFSGKKFKFNAYEKWEKEQLKDENNPLLSYNLTEDRIMAIYKDGVFYQDATKYFGEFDFSGRIIGGCMDCLVNLLGTKFDKVKAFNEKYSDGIIWALESCDLNVFSIRRAMWQMDQAGWFQNVKGFLIGRPANGEDMMNLNRFDAILHVARKYNVPVLMDIDMGHRPPMIPILMGSIANVHVKGNDMDIEFSLR